MSQRVLEIDGRRIEVVKPDKPMFAVEGITKADLIDYYQRIAEVMLPHLRNRPLTLERYPDGIDAEGFYQKEAPEYFPDWIRTVEIEKEEGTIRQVICDDAATLVFLANQATITPHTWLSTTHHLRRPDRMVFDLDPADGEVGKVAEAARLLWDLLDELGLRARLMTTGSRGYHLVVPLVPEADFDQVRRFARRFADLAASRRPDLVTVEIRKARRSGVFIDYLRNGYGQTTVAPYAVRARRGAPVATPIDWEELSRVRPSSYTIRNIHRRLGQKKDPWMDDGVPSQHLEPAEERLRELA